MFDTLIKKEKVMQKGQAPLKKKVEKKEAYSPKPERFPDVPNLWDLSSHEFAVVRLQATGMAFTAIAKKLCISPKTVSTYLTRAKVKMGALNTTHAALIFDRHYRQADLVDPMQIKYEKAQRCAEAVLESTKVKDTEIKYALTAGQLLDWHTSFLSQV